MNLRLYIALWIAVAVYFACLLGLLRKKRLELRYTLLWLFAGVVMALILVMPQAFERAVHWAGVVEMTNGVFAVALFLLLIIFIAMTSVMSKMNASMRTLTQKIAQYEKRIRELENERGGCEGIEECVAAPAAPDMGGMY